MRRTYDQLCGIATALDVVGDRWTLLVVRDLLLGPLRFSDLAAGLPGLGTNTLSERLKHLELAGVVRRRALPLPDAGTAYELTSDGRELEPILMSLGRWGARRMDRLPADIVSHSRWLAAAMLAFHDDGNQVARPTTWELRLTDGPFTVRADGAIIDIRAGAAEDADLIVTASDLDLHGMLSRRLSPEEAVRSGAVALDGDRSLLTTLLALFRFPAPAGAE